jgi:hypothetical protein
METSTQGATWYKDKRDAPPPAPPPPTPVPYKPVLAALERRLLVAVLNSIKAWIRHPKAQKSLTDWSWWNFCCCETSWTISRFLFSRTCEQRWLPWVLRHRKSGNIVSVCHSIHTYVIFPFIYHSFIHPSTTRVKEKKKQKKR